MLSYLTQGLIDLTFSNLVFNHSFGLNLLGSFLAKHMERIIGNFTPCSTQRVCPQMKKKH